MDDANSIIKEIKTDFSPVKKYKETGRKTTSSISRVPTDSGKKLDVSKKVDNVENHSHLRSSSHLKVDKELGAETEDNKEAVKSIALQYKRSIKSKVCSYIILNRMKLRSQRKSHSYYNATLPLTI